MVQFALENGNVLEIDEYHSLDQNSFDMLCETLQKKEIPDILDISYYFRKDYERCRKLLDLALGKAKPSASGLSNIVEPSSVEEVKIKILGLMIQHKKESRDLVDELQFVNDKRYDYIKGFALIDMNQYDDSELHFSKINNKKGMAIARIFKQDFESALVSTDPVIRCYASSSNWKKIEIQTTNKDFLFRIGQSDEYGNEDNLDVKITLIDRTITEESNKETVDCTVLRTCLSKLSEIQNDVFSAELAYMSGKIYHLMKEYERAEIEYTKAIGIDENCIPARLNLCRIQQVPFGNDAKSNPNSCLLNSAIDKCLKQSPICDYNTLIALKQNIFDINLNYCSDLVRKIAWTVIQMRMLNRDALSTLELVENYFDQDVVKNNKAILLKNYKMLEKLLGVCDPSLKEFVLYNLAVLKKDAEMLSKISLPEAKLQLDFLTKNTETCDASLRSFLLLSKADLAEQSDLFPRLLHGCICIKESMASEITSDLLKSAEDIFLSCTNSLYAINGLAIIHCMKKNYSYAIKLFKQIVDDFDAAYLNLGNAYFLNKEYSKALECYIKVIDKHFEEHGKASSSYNDDRNKILSELKISRDILKFLVSFTKDMNTIDKLINLGFKDLKDAKALILLENGEIEVVKNMNLSDDEIVSKLNCSIEREQERKRKIAELEEYRKKRNIQ